MSQPQSQSGPGAAAVGQEDLQVLEFALGQETYCVDIEYIAELVDMGDITPVPNTPRHVEGVMDLRGRTTSIVDPKTVLGISGSGPRKRIIVFDPDKVGDQGAVGWIADEVYEVVRVDEEEIEESPGSDEEVVGIVKRDGDFKVMVDPESFDR